MPPRLLGVSIIAAALSLAPAAAHAHWVPGDADPGRSLYLLPGPLVSLVTPLSRGRASLLMDVGVELSVHRFVPTSDRLWSQFGYGAFVQAQGGGLVLEPDDATASSPHLRLAAGAQGNYGPIGALAGLSTRVLSETQAGSVGAFAGLFLSIGIMTATFQVEVPFAHAGDGERQPAVFSSGLMVKWPITVARLPGR